MKIRTGFVSNSSSSSFMITNKTTEAIPLYRFVEENPQLIEKFNSTYGYTEKEGYSQEKLIESAKEDGTTLLPGQHSYTFGDEHGTLIGQVFDYILRDSSSSENFEWFCWECRGEEF